MSRPTNITIPSADRARARRGLETGSIWPCIVLHAACNSVIQGAF